MLKSAAQALLVVGLLGVSGPVRAAEAESVQDLRCLTTFAAAMSQTQDPKLESLLTMGVWYFLGRVQGREPEIDLEARLKAASQELRGSDLKPELQRCGAVVQAKGEELTLVGKHLQDAGAAKPAP